MRTITIALRCKSLADDDSSGWFDLLLPFERRSQLSGRTETVTADDIAKILDNWDGDGPGVPVGYNHAALKGALDPESTKAAGWIKELRLSDDGVLQARIEFNETGKVDVEKGHFSFLSAEIVPDALPEDPANNESIGSALIGATLTNRPFAPGLSPVALSESLSMSINDQQGEEQTAPAEPQGETVLKHAIKILGLDESATVDDATKALDDLTDERDALMAEIDALKAKLADVESQIEGGDGSDNAEALTKLTDRITALEADKVQLLNDATVTAAISSKRLAPAERDAALKVLDAGGTALFDSVYPTDRVATLADLAPIGAAGAVVDPEANDDESSDALQIKVASLMASSRAETGRTPTVAQILSADGHEALRDNYLRHFDVIGLPKETQK